MDKLYLENEYVVYKRNVCKVKEIKNNKINGNDYYTLIPIDDESLTINVPVDNKLGYLRGVMTKDDATNLINNIPNIEPVKDINDKYIERTYKDLLSSGTKEDLVKIIKTTYLRNDDRLKSNKKISEKDSNYFSQAEKYLYNEISVALGMRFDETRDYVIKKVEELIK